MEKYTGLFNRGDIYLEESLKKGSITIDGASLKIDLGSMTIFPNTNFIMKSDDTFIKIYCKEFISNGKGNANKVVLFENSDEAKLFGKDNIYDIDEVIFSVINLREWIGEPKIEKIGDSIEPILIEESDKKVTIEFIYIKFNEFPYIEYKPLIKIKYNNKVNIDIVEKDISIITRFFSVLIGRLDGVEDIGIKLNGMEKYYRYYSTREYVHLNQEEYKELYSLEGRTRYKNLSNNLSEYYANWKKFYQDYKNVMINYFYFLSKPLTCIEDEFTTWCQIYDGLSIHESHIDLDAKELKKDILPILKKKELKGLMDDAFKKAGSKYKPEKVATWIKDGFIIRKAFGDRLKDICERNFNFIDRNLQDINFYSEKGKDIYYHINKTRNYYIHLKEDDEDVLNIEQMYRLNKLLCSTFIAVILNNLGFSESEMKIILKKDDIASFNMIGIEL